MIRSLSSFASCALSLLLSGVAIGWASNAHAMWPTTSWAIKNTTQMTLLEGFEEKHRAILEYGSRWFASMSFKAPFQVNDQGRFVFTGGEKYLAYLNKDPSNPGSSYSSKGNMYLSIHPGFLNPSTPNDRVYQGAAIHELFHSIQAAYPAYQSYATRPDLPGPPRCDEGERANAWLTEGTASAVQIMYLERAHGETWNHPFRGPSYIRWVRAFDQPLDWGWIPAQHSLSLPDGVAQHAWQCSYGTWYFWYAVGNMLGSTNVQDNRRVAYLKHIFEQTGPWAGTGLEMVDAGLKQAAEELNALQSYRGGLYALYPQFVAQYLDRDVFYEKIKNITLPVPSVYETHIDIDNALEPLSTRAWRIRVQMPPGLNDVPTTVRFALNSDDPAIKDALHLIIDSRVVTRPLDPSVPYSQLRRVHPHLLDEEGGIDYLVRVANVARNAVLTNEATFTLKVEVEGFYGSAAPEPDYTPVTEPDSPPPPLLKADQPAPLITETPPLTPLPRKPEEQTLLSIPPGFQITGPDSQWSCEGSDDARASYAIYTPNRLADELERMLPQVLKNIENDLDQAEIEAHRQGESELAALRQQRDDFETGFSDLMEGSSIHDKVAKAAQEIRRSNETQILVKLNGKNQQGNCDVLMILTLSGATAAQRIRSDNFQLTITSASFANAMSAAASVAAQFDFSALESMDIEKMKQFEKQLEHALEGTGLSERPWSRCSPEQNDCEEGGFELGEVSEERLFGSFSFQVYRGDLQLVRNSHVEDPREYAEVGGFINITSTKDAGDNNLMDFMSRSSGDGDLLLIPGLESFLQGGTMLKH